MEAGRGSAQGGGIVTWRGTDSGSPKDPTQRGLRGIKEGKENAERVCLGAKGKRFQNKPVTTGNSKRDIKLCESRPLVRKWTDKLMEQMESSTECKRSRCELSK